MRKRRFIVVTALALLAAFAPCRAQAPIVTTGESVPGMSSLDSVVTSLMRTYNMPGAAIAMVKDGRLVYARGFGWSDVEGRIPVEPTALFRIASLSKPITSAAVMKLVEEGKVHLTDPAFDYLRDLAPAPGTTRDPRLARITIEMLLQHTGGWDRDATFDPMFIPQRAAAAVGAPAPAAPETIIRYMLGQPLQHEPGTVYSYSNFGYSVLGRIIERVSGMPYAAYVHKAILDPAGAIGMRIGATRLTDRAVGEVKYYPVGGLPFGFPTVASVFPGGGSVPIPYGSFYMEALDSHGGWLASAVDLAKFITAVDRLPTRRDVLSPASIQRMVSRPANTPASAVTWYADGWSVRPAGNDANWWHTGSLPGTTTLMVRAYNGLAWVALFNASAADKAFAGALDQGMWTAVAGVKSWPSHDLFARFQ